MGVPFSRIFHSYLKLTEVPLLLGDVPTLGFCLGGQRSRNLSGRAVFENILEGRERDRIWRELHQHLVLRGGT